MKTHHYQKSKTYPSRMQKIIAFACAAAVWFSINIGQTAQAAQNDPSIAAAPAVSVAAPTASITDAILASGSGIAIVGVSVLAIAILGYNLIATGKQGWGWMTLCIVGGVLMIFTRLAIALFREISSANSVYDWDD